MPVPKLKELAKIEISAVDKKSKPGQREVRLCNFTDVYYNWAITNELHDSFMIASASDKEIETFTIHKGQVAITKDSETRDDIGISAYIADDFDDVVLGYHTALITPNEEKLNPKYLNVYLHSPFMKKYFEYNATGSGQRYTLFLDAIENIPVYLPSIKDQEKIGSLFSLYDRKIKINESINAELEKTVKELYDFWFLKFNFPDDNGLPYSSNGGNLTFCPELNRDIPEGWEIKQYSEILDKYKSTKKFESKEYQKVGLYPIVDQGPKFIVGFTDDRNSLLDRIPATLFGDHSLNVKFLNFPFARGADGTQILYSKEPRISPYYLYLSVKSLNIPNPGYSRHFKYLKEMYILVPPQNICDKFAEKVKRIFEMWSSNILSNIELNNKREYLLPLLVTGQIRIN